MRIDTLLVGSVSYRSIADGRPPLHAEAPLAIETSCGRVARRVLDATRRLVWQRVRLGRQQFLLFVSGRTRLAVIVPARDARRLTAALTDAVSDGLTALGVPAAQVEQERQQMSEVVFARTNDRSVLGTMNDYAFMARATHARGDGPETPAELMHFFACTPIIPLGCVTPEEMVRETVGGSGYAPGSKTSLA